MTNLLLITPRSTTMEAERRHARTRRALARTVFFGSLAINILMGLYIAFR